MKLREIFRFEAGYQARRVTTWLYAAVVLFVAFSSVRGNYAPDARRGDFLLNSPFVIAAVTVMSCVVWLLVGAYVAGDAATRDVRTRMHPLSYTAPVGRADYLGGRFLAAFALNAAILLSVPAGILLAVHLPGVEPEIVGPFRPSAYLLAYLFIALPNAFAVTAVQFSVAALTRRAAASYLASAVLFVTAYIVAGGVAGPLGMRELGKLLDPIGVVGVLSELSGSWTTAEKNTRLVGLQGSLLANRLTWIGIALGVLALTHRRFRFAHPAEDRSRRRRSRNAAPAAPAHEGITRNAPISVPRARRTFGAAIRARQTLAIARASFRQLATSRGGLVLPALVAAFVVVVVPWNMKFMGVPLLPRTSQVLSFLTAPLTDFRTPWIVIPLFVVFYAGELVWRERDAGLSEIADGVPVPEWVLFTGRYLGLALVLVAWMALLAAAGLLVQLRLGAADPDVGPYLAALFGLQLSDYLLFALLALVVHVLVDDKYLGHLAALVVYGLIVFASTFGVEHDLLVYGAGPDWSYTEMRGFGPFLGPWLWFKAYWAAWALLLAVAGTLLWVRGREESPRVRLRLARGRLSRGAAGTAAAAVALIVGLGGFIFYNTNVLNDYRTAADGVERRAEYERRYARYDGVPQPTLTATSLRVEIHPDRRRVEIGGAYRLVNRSGAPIDSIHLATAPDVETGPFDFDRPATPVVEDDDLGHRIYALGEPLQPGDSLRVGFRVRVEPRGFGNRGVDASVTGSATLFTSREWLPGIGYRPDRALGDAGARRAHGLPPRPAVPPLDDADARRDVSGAGRMALDAVVGTPADQIGVAPGVLRRTWTEGGRRYVHYVTDAPIETTYGILAARYALHRARWNDVDIEIFHDPADTANLDRMVRAARATLEYGSEQLGPYPYGYLRLVERPGEGFELSAGASMIAYEEGFSLLDPDADPRSFDLPFAVTAHEVAHQWWGAQLSPAPVEGAGLLSESLSTYTAMKVVERTLGPEQLRLYVERLRAAYDVPRTRAAPPLLRATDPFLAYRKGPFALYALAEYVGEERVNGALRRLLEEHGSGEPPLPTSLDLYRELRAVTPDSLRPLLHDLFEANTFWELRTESATAERIDGGAWRVALDVRARKVVVDTAGVETVVPMDDPVEVGVFAEGEAGPGAGEPLHLRTHRIRSGEQTITVIVQGMPVFAGVDPKGLLTYPAAGAKIERVQIED